MLCTNHTHSQSCVCVVCVLQRHLTVRVLFFLPYLHSLVLNVSFWFFSYLLFFVFFLQAVLIHSAVIFVDK